ncbi:MAG: flagellar assembly protein A [Spirochaetota bacterium]
MKKDKSKPGSSKREDENRILDLMKNMGLEKLGEEDFPEEVKQKIKNATPEELKKLEEEMGLRDETASIKAHSQKEPEKTDVEEDGEFVENKQTEVHKKHDVDGWFKIHIAEDKMSAAIDLVPSQGGGKSLSFPDIQQTIAEMGICYGVNWQLLQKLIERVEKTQNSKQGVIFAQGHAPEDGQDGSIEFHFSNSDEIFQE